MVNRGGEKFTAHEATKALELEYDTVNHYIRYWARRGALELVGTGSGSEAEKTAKKLGRPENYWTLVATEYVPIWRTKENQ